MAMHFNGEFVVTRNRDEVYEFLTDPRRFSPLLPDYQSMTQEDDTHFAVKVKVGISHIRGTAEAKVHLAESVRPTHAVYKGQAKVVGGSTTVTAGFDLDEVPEGGTKVRWTGEAQVFGSLASMAGGLLQPIARKNLEKLISGLHQALAAAGAMPQAPQPVAASQPGQPGTTPQAEQQSASAQQQAVNSATGGSSGNG